MSYVGAPYNFVPFENKTNSPVQKEDLEVHDRIDDSLLSGEISYRMTAVTPIMVDNGKGFFFKNEYNQFAIPGSTVRGLLRNNVQILSGSSFDGDIDDYNLMYRNVASGAQKKEYNDVLGNKTIPYGKGSISILQNVRGGAISCKKGKYYIHPTKTESVERNMPNYYVLSERTIVEEYLKDGPEFPFDLFIDNGNSILQNRIDIPFRKIQKNGRVQYIQDEKNDRYKPYFKECSYVANGKNIKAVSSPDKYGDQGIVISTGKMNNKKAVYIIPEVDMDNSRVISIPESDIKAFKIDLKKKENTLMSFFDRKDRKKAAKEAEKFYGLPAEGETKPVFYIYLNGRLYFGFTPRLRLFYDHSIKEGYKQLQPKGSFDLSTSIFGLSDKDKGSYKSKVSMSDAVMISGNEETEKKIVLAEPKPSSYLDYLVQMDGNKRSTYSSAGFELRGVKQYWLRDGLYFGNQNKNNENIGSKIRPLSAGSVFEGKIRFNNLSRKELGLLLWGLKLEPDSQMNVGKGKPYGYGCISVSDIKTKVLDNKKAYGFEELSFDPFRQEDTDQLIMEYKETQVFGKKVSELSSVKAFLKMKDSEKKPNPELIRYMSIDAKDYQSRDLRLQTVDEVLEGKAPIRKETSQKGTERKGMPSRNKTVIISRIDPDRKNPGNFVGHFEEGMIFDVPADITPGEEVVVKVTSEKNGRVYAKYIRKA